MRKEIITYDDKGNEVYCRFTDGFEIWSDYDYYGKKRYFRNFDGEEWWKGNLGKLITEEEFKKLLEGRNLNTQ